MPAIAPSAPVDCRISADPAAFLLVAYGRVGQVVATRRHLAGEDQVGEARCGVLAVMPYCLPVIRYRVLITGQVQGVNFRAACRRMALQHGVRGWVRNLPDGRVEAAFEGSADDVRQLLDWTRRGPQSAVVADVAVQAEQPEGLNTFSIMY